MMILLPEYGINCCLLACCRRSGSQVLSSGGGEPVKLYTGKTRRDWDSFVFFLINFSPVPYYLNTWNRLTAYKPWTYTSLKGVLGGL